MSPFNVVLVGAGEINFGSPEGPWNHTARLETLLGGSLVVLSLIDPDLSKSKARIASKLKESSQPQSWIQTQSHASVGEAALALAGVSIHLVIVGCPPHFRGTQEPGKNMDMQLLEAFPAARGFIIEKPVAAADPQRVDCDAVAAAYARSNAIVSVGYMFRYLDIVERVRAIMQREKLVPISINARYIMAYEEAKKLAWWNKDQSCGPVVEQATHFVDLVRYLAGTPVQAETIRAITVEYGDVAGSLAKLGFDEVSLISPEQRVPRSTMATWKHETGTVSSLSHTIALHGTTYSTEIDIVADGWLFRLSDFYTQSPKLSIMSCGSPVAELVSEKDDPFLRELDAIIQAIHGTASGATPPEEGIKSSYADALDTYKLTWAIRRAGESS